MEKTTTPSKTNIDAAAAARAIAAHDGVDVIVHPAPEMGRAVVMIFNGGWSVSAWMPPEGLLEMARRCTAAAAVLGKSAAA